MRLIDADQLLNFIRFDEQVIAPEEHTAQDIVMMIQTAPTISPPPNAPLTLSELREMDGKAVYVTGLFTDCSGKRHGAWALVDVKQKMCRVHGGGLAIFENHEKSWLAYRRKPGDETNAAT